jgi:hypothetical protein
MSEEIKEAKRAYMRDYMKAWRKKNPEKEKEIRDRYWIKRAKAMDPNQAK